MTKYFWHRRLLGAALTAALTAGAVAPWAAESPPGELEELEELAALEAFDVAAETEETVTMATEAEEPAAELSEIFSGKCGENVTWQLDTGTGILNISGTGEMTKGAYASPWYSHNKSIQQAKIQRGVTSIGDFAFYSCSNLTSIDIADSVTSIGWNAFAQCGNLDSINIPGSVTSIGQYAFNYCSSLTNVNLSNRVISIGQFAFSHCPISHIYIPASVIDISDTAFLDCSSLIDIDVDVNNAQYHSENGALFNKDMTSILCCPEGKTDFTIPGSVINIGNHAFHNCSSLNSVTIQSDITSIGDYAFCACKNLSKINIPDSVTSIGELAFSSCEKLTDINIPANLVNISEGAFIGCNGLTSVTIPGSVTNIGTGVFSSCSNLTSVTILNGVTDISFYMFSNCEELSSVILPDSITSIESVAFSGCSKLNSINIPKNVSMISGSTFAGCSSLTDIEVDSNNNNYCSKNGVIYSKDMTELVRCPEGKTDSFTIANSITRIGDSAFYSCSNLNSISIPVSVTQIGHMAFYDCNSLTDIYYSGSETDWQILLSSIEEYSYNDILFSENIEIHYNSKMPPENSNTPEVFAALDSESPNRVYIDDPDNALSAETTVLAAHYDENGRMLEIQVKSIDIKNMSVEFDDALSSGWKLFFTGKESSPLCRSVILP